MRVREVVENTIRLFFAVTMGLALVGFLPTGVQADDGNPVDLELGGEGATRWNITDVQPADSGIQTVDLLNIGSQDGFVTIWVSDIISSEGLNPQSETGDTREPGELADNLLFNLTADGLSTNLNLPTTFNNLPQSVSWPQYIDIIPLKVDATINLQWQWELPAQVGNENQGDVISFTINYLLTGFEITDVSGVTTGEGAFLEEVTVESATGNGEFTIEVDTIAHTEEGDPLSEIWLIEIDKEPSAPSVDTTTVGAYYDVGPHGIIFEQPITITCTYDPGDIPPGVNELDLFIALWDEGVSEWVPLEGCIVNTADNTISAPVHHFSRYAIISPVPPPLPPLEAAEPPPPEVVEETVETILDMLGDEGRVETEPDGTLREPLTLTDPDGYFVLEIDSGSKMTGAGNVELSRIELRITDESIAVPDSMLLISPIYRLTGYTRSMESTRIDFEPPARLTIRYDLQDLPENALMPFVVNYTDEQGLVRLRPAPDSLVEIGKAKALVSHASLFAVAVVVLPPPTPLPARFEASNLTINPRQAQPGQAVTISLTITNEGATAGSLELHLIVDGIVRAVEEVTLTEKSSETLTFEVSNLAVGSHQVKIAGLTGRFSVVSIAVLPVEAGVNWFLLDVSVGAALVVGILILYFSVLRSRRERQS